MPWVVLQYEVADAPGAAITPAATSSAAPVPRAAIRRMAFSFVASRTIGAVSMPKMRSDVSTVGATGRNRPVRFLGQQPPEPPHARGARPGREGPGRAPDGQPATAQGPVIVQYTAALLPLPPLCANRNIGSEPAES
ncbi:hypothetical protein GCM10010519_45020 [Streptomyces lactacystinicus]